MLKKKVLHFDKESAVSFIRKVDSGLKKSEIGQTLSP